MSFEHLFDTYLSKTGNAVWDHEIARYVQKNIGSWVNDLDSLHCRAEFIAEFQRWIESSELNSFKGLDSFPIRYATLGTTQALDAIHASSDVWVLPGEYPYNRDVGRRVWEDADWTPFFAHSGGTIIISLPFSATGEKHPKFDQLLDEALARDINVFVDCAWFGTCGGIEVDLSHPAIWGAAFSTSKGLASGNWRAGVCFIKRGWLEPLRTQNAWDHSIHLNNKIGLELLRKFDPDHVYNKYRQAQLDVCEVYGLTPSSCVHIGIGGEGWEHFQRSDGTNRVNLRNAIKDMYKTGECRT